MIYLTGVSNPRVVEAASKRANLGLLAQPDNSLHTNGTAFTAWAADNGCFAKGDRFDLESYIGTYLPAAKAAGGRLLFATAPDVVGDHIATVRRSVPVLGRIRALGIPAAFVAQDGMELDERVRWDLFDVLFVGGSTEWKLGPGAAAVVAEAKARGKWVHMGRVNSWKRLAYATSIGCDSADGTFLAFGPDANLPRLLKWLDKLDALEATTTTAPAAAAA